jgi:hypothetical protein
MEGIERLEKIFNKSAKITVKKQAPAVKTQVTVSVPTKPIKAKNSKKAKLKKLFRNPHQFFDDSKLKLIKPLRHLF